MRKDYKELYIITDMDRWDKTERWKSHKIWSYFRLLDIDKLFHTKRMWHRPFANIMFYMGIFHVAMWINYYVGLALYYSVQGDPLLP